MLFNKEQPDGYFWGTNEFYPVGGVTLARLVRVSPQVTTLLARLSDNKRQTLIIFYHQKSVQDEV